MTRRNNLIPIMAKRYRIQQGLSEPYSQWYMRVIYSVLGQMAYASLWDSTEDGQPVSVVHFKSRIEKLVSSYCDIFGDLRTYFGNNYDRLMDEIYTVQLNGGLLYHSAYRLAPAQFSFATAEQIMFTRGMAPGEEKFVSGQGTYRYEQKDSSSNPLLKMFRLPETTLTETWEHLLKTATWNQFQQNDSIEFLRVNPPFNYGYWQRQKPEKCKVSLMRMGMRGSYFYYLYKENGGNAFISQLPIWLTDGHRYRRVSNALLAASNTLPSAIYHVDGQIVTLRLQYLMPSEEMNFVKLYSWPTSCIDLPHDFKRIFTKEIFFALKRTLDTIGYNFIEKHKSIRFPEKNFYAVTLFAAEQKQSAFIWIHFEILHDIRNQTADSFAHIGIPCNDIHIFGLTNIPMH